MLLLFMFGLKETARTIGSARKQEKHFLEGGISHWNWYPKAKFINFVSGKQNIKKGGTALCLGIRVGIASIYLTSDTKTKMKQNKTQTQWIWQTEAFKYLFKAPQI